MGAKQSNNYQNPRPSQENIQSNNYQNPRPSQQNIQQNKYNEKKETITLDEVYECLEDYKQVINNVYILNKLLDDNYDYMNEKLNDGDDNPINSIFSDLLHDEYDNSVNEQFVEIIELTKNPRELNHCRYLFSCKKYENLDGLSLMNIKTANVTKTIDDLSYVNVANLLEYRIAEMCRKIPMYGKLYIHSGFSMWTKGVKIYFNLIRKHPLFPEKWIMVSSGLNISSYTEKNTQDPKQFSNEFRLLMENITQVMNSNVYLQIIEESLEEAQKIAEESITLSEEKNALYDFSKKVLDNAPYDVNAKLKEQEAKLEAQNSSRMAANAVTQAKAAQYSLTEAEASIATKTTTWEYGTEDEYENLRCIFSGVHPQWNGLYIKDCTLHGSKYNIAEVTFNVMSDIEQYYTQLSNNQIILSSYVTEYGKHIAIVKIIKHGQDIHFQMKEAHLDMLFGSNVQHSNEQETPSQEGGGTRSHIFLDPSTYFVGIGTNERTTKYSENYATTKNYNLQHVVIKSGTYPNIVSNRVAENPRHIQSNPKKNNYFFFDQFSSATMRRESNLYTFDELYQHTEDGSEVEENTKKYGADISFELTDKNKNTNEIGNIGMVIDKISENGEVFGGLSIKTKPNLYNINGKNVIKPGNTIMYVTSDGLLHISGIMLGNKILSVQKDDEDEEHLYWGDDKIL